MKKKIALMLVLTMILTLIPSVGTNAATAQYNYAKLLQYSLYFYDANMCGTKVDEHGLLDWRNDCHTSDKTTYTRSDGTTVEVDVTGGFHDAGDHVKFGLPQAYTAFTLGMSYDTNKSAYISAGQEGHLQMITTHFADYLVDCTVLSSDGSYVETFVCQVGQGGAGYDHGYWGAPENQVGTNRPIYFTCASAPSTDIVSLSAAALLMQYKNFGGEQYKNTAIKLFEYAKMNNKAVNKTACTDDSTATSDYYRSSGWEDDYCLAAIMLYNLTGDISYLNEYNRYKDTEKAGNVYWPLGWDNVAPAVAYYSNNGTKLNNIMNITSGSNLEGFKCILDWGSARYNTSMQYTAFLYDKVTGVSTYGDWAESQMQYLLGSNSRNQCYVVGYSSNSAKYPHHRAASGYTGSVQGTTPQAHVLIGALVGGPKTSGEYNDSANDYTCNEVAIDYNATLVASAAALYEHHMDEGAQAIDENYYMDEDSVYPEPTPEEGIIISDGIYVMENSTKIIAGMCANSSDKSELEYRWLACEEKDGNWFEVSGWTKGNEWLVWDPDIYGPIILVCQTRISGNNNSQIEASVGINHKLIKGKCQMPYTGEGGGYLIGVETYDNPEQQYYYELLVLDCTLLEQGKDAWVWTTGKCKVSENFFWAVWQPEYGYYWTLFRVYDSNGNLLDEECYSFCNAY